MSRVTVKRSLVIITALLVGGGFLTACGGGGEESQLIRAFFQASRFNDRTTVGNMSMVFFPPEEEGIASSPSIDSMQEEQRKVIAGATEKLQEISGKIGSLEKVKEGIESLGEKEAEKE